MPLTRVLMDAVPLFLPHAVMCKVHLSMGDCALSKTSTSHSDSRV